MEILRFPNYSKAQFIILTNELDECYPERVRLSPDGTLVILLTDGWRYGFHHAELYWSDEGMVLGRADDARALPLTALVPLLYLMINASPLGDDDEMQKPFLCYGLPADDVT